jgi:hypothetical protein
MTFLHMEIEYFSIWPSQFREKRSLGSCISAIPVQ